MGWWLWWLYYPYSPMYDGHAVTISKTNGDYWKKVCYTLSSGKQLNVLEFKVFVKDFQTL